MIHRQYLVRKFFLVFLLVAALWLLSDNETSMTDTVAATTAASTIDNDDDGSGRYYRSTSRHHLAVSTALRRHPPCLRIYRALLEFNLMVWGLALSLYIWQSTIGNKMVGHLLFQRVDHNPQKDESVYFTEASQGRYKQINQQEEEGREQDDDEKFVVVEHQEKPGDDDNKNHDPNSNFELVVPPSPGKVANFALDSLLLILISLFLFTLSSAEGGRYVDGMAKLNTFKFIALVAAPIFPLVLFLAACLASVIPWNDKRRSQWLILSYTIGAPMYHVTFRDGFVGDVLTSSVRPLQDVAFTVFYLVSGLNGWWKQSYDLDAADLPLESNWLLHTFLLPMCMVSPLWWRFSQNLRQTYEYKQRWPYLGNALKYFIAAEVAVFGVYMQSRKQSALWLTAFVVATLYQIWWDVFMDWELLVVTKWKDVSWDLTGNGQSLIQFPIPLSVRLRKTRIYSVSWMYWSIFFTNIVLRFCWTLSFLPPHYLNQAGVLSETFEGDLTAILNPTIASAEIVRRILWGWLRVEWEAIKVARKEPRLKGAWRDCDAEDSSDDVLEGHLINTGRQADLELRAMDVNDTSVTHEDLAPPTTSLVGWWVPRRMYDMTEMQIIGELCIYATIFTGLGLMAAAHRDTL